MQDAEEKERIEAIKRHLNGEKPVEICKKLGRSRPWLNKWIKRYDPTIANWYEDLPKTPKISPQKIDEGLERVIIKIRESLMDGSDETMMYGHVGAEAIQYQMEKLGYDPSELPSISTIKRIINRNHLRINKKERYKRVKSKGRYTIIKPEFVDELHQMDFVGPRYIKGFGPINSLHLKDIVSRQVAGNQYTGKSMDNVIAFLLDYWKHHPIPRYLQTDNGMSFVGDFFHPRTFSRYVRLCLYVGIEVVFIAPAKPWMNGSIEEFNKEFDGMFWKSQLFKNLTNIRKQSKIFYEEQNNYNKWKETKKKSLLLSNNRLLPKNFKIDLQNIPLVSGKIHFIRIVNSNGDITVINENFHIGVEYIGEYVWATIETGNHKLKIIYNDKNMQIQNIKNFDYHIDEIICDLDEYFKT